MSGGDAGPFALRLRRLRETARLTQEELAERAGLSAKAISALERGERRRPYPHTIRSLATALGLSDSDYHDLAVAARRKGESAEAPHARVEPLPPLPTPLTPLFGRERDSAAIAALLGEARLVTLIGPGGVGKTRLALALADRVRDRYPDGLFFIPLAPLLDSTSVLPEIARTLGINE